MRKYRHRPNEVEAVQYLSHDFAIESYEWSGGKVSTDEDDQTTTVATARGPVTPQIGDWLVKDSSGEISVLTPEQFEDNFERIFA